MGKESDIKEIKINEAFEIKVNKVVKEAYEKLKGKGGQSFYYIDEITSGGPDLEENFISVQGTRTPLKEEEVPNVEEREIITVEIVQPEEMDGSFVNDGRIPSDEEIYKKNLDYIELLEDKNPYIPKKKKDQLVEEVEAPLEPEIVEKTEENIGPLSIDEMMLSELQKAVAAGAEEVSFNTVVAPHETLESAQRSLDRLIKYGSEGILKKITIKGEVFLLNPPAEGISDTDWYEIVINNAWCGWFIGYCYRDVLTDSFRKRVLPSNFRTWNEFFNIRKRNIFYFEEYLNSLRKRHKEEVNKIKSTNGDLNAFFTSFKQQEEEAFYELFPRGCILSCLHRGDKNKPYGMHFGVFASVNFDVSEESIDGIVNAFEGNAASLINGQVGAIGVAANTRLLEDYVFAVLPEKEDYKFYEKIYKREVSAFEAKNKRKQKSLENAYIEKRKQRLLKKQKKLLGNYLEAAKSEIKKNVSVLISKFNRIIENNPQLGDDILKQALKKFKQRMVILKNQEIEKTKTKNLTESQKNKIIKMIENSLSSISEMEKFAGIKLHKKLRGLK